MTVNVIGSTKNKRWASRNPTKSYKIRYGTEYEKLIKIKIL